MILWLSGCALTGGKPVDSNSQEPSRTAEPAPFAPAAVSKERPAASPAASCGKLPEELAFAGKTYLLKERSPAAEPGMKLGYMKCEQGRLTAGDATDPFTVYTVGDPRTNSDILLYGDRESRARYMLEESSR
ncbi:hypothetical protein MJA45_01730 [Paenibacillus aurantius]|uniref:Uncharacterized protein n=1 Tax=Paenibacillus aurantius TaxID=2918900 RepID=A0AA96RFS7_9BACL|nr:hypothetical protein [Paenibacillus aurantius]WNQ11801.1 hypothetical protein MJA45_01730 [Paenibacillus aurantius]